MVRFRIPKIFERTADSSDSSSREQKFMLSAGITSITINFVIIMHFIDLIKYNKLNNRQYA